MNSLKTICLSVLSLSVANAFATTRPLADAQKIASKTLTNSQLVTLSHVKTSSADTLYYVFTGNVGGYAIISANQQSVPVLGYSKEGGIGDMPESLQLMLNNCSNNTDILQNGSASGSRLKATRITNKAIKPLLGDITWNQREPYYNKTPLISGKHALTGCVATAMAQVLCYYRYPSEVKAEIPAYTSKKNKLYVASVRKGTAIDWDNILDSYNDSYNNIQANAVASLFSIVGSATEMDYGTDESASNASVAELFVNHFGYDADLIRMADRYNYTFAEWSDLVYSELAENRPVYFSGATMTSAHAFICDGIDANGLFHINWGWGGSSNGYFDLALLNPHNTSGAGASSSKDGYSGYSHIVYGITPDNGVHELEKHPTAVKVTNVVNQYLINPDTYEFDPNRINPSSIVYSYDNVSYQDTTVYLSLGYVGDNNKVTTVASLYKSELKAYASESDFFDLSESAFKEGIVYQVGLVESADGAVFTPCEDFKRLSILVTKKGGELVRVDTCKLSATAKLDEFYQLDEPVGCVVSFSNTGRKEYYDKFYFYTNSENKRPDDFTYAATITAEVGETNDVDFSFVPTSETVFYWIADVNNNIIAQGKWVMSAQQFTATAELISFKYLDEKVKGAIHFNNKSEKDYSGKFYLLTNTVNEQPRKYTVSDDVVVKAGKTLDFDFSFTPEEDTVFYWVLNAEAKKLGSGFWARSKPDYHINAYVSIDTFYFDEVSYKINLINDGDDDYKDDISLRLFCGDDVLDYADLGGFASYCIFGTDSVTGENYVELNDYITVEAGDSMEYSDNVVDLIFDTYNISKVCIYDAFGVMIATAPASVANFKAENFLTVLAEPSALVVEASAPVKIFVADIFGRVVASRLLQQDDVFRANLPSGVYIVNGIKVLIR